MTRKKLNYQERYQIRMQGGRGGLVEASSKMDIHEFRVFMTMLTLVLPEDNDFAEYELRTKDIIRLFSLGDDGRYYHAIRDAAARLFNRNFVFVETKEDGKEYKVTIHLLDETSEPLDEAEQNRIRVKFNPKLKPYLLQLKKEYLTIDVRNVENLQSPHSLKLYMVLKHQFNLGNRKVSYTISRLKEILALEAHEYSLYGNFKQKIIKKGIKDLEKHTDLKIHKLEEIKSGRAVEMVVFHLEGMSSVKTKKSYKDRGSDEVLAESKFDDYELDPKSNPLISNAAAKIHNLVSQYISQDTVQKWIDQYPIEQIEKGISYGLKQIKKGKVKNPGAYLQKIVATVEIVDSEETNRIGKQIGVRKLTNQKDDQLSVDIDTLRRQSFEISLSDFHNLIKEKEEALGTVLGKLRQGMFGNYYKDQLSLSQNLANPSLSALLVDIARNLYPEYFGDDLYLEEQIRALEIANR